MREGREVKVREDGQQVAHGERACLEHGAAGSCRASSRRYWRAIIRAANGNSLGRPLAQTVARTRQSGGSLFLGAAWRVVAVGEARCPQCSRLVAAALRLCPTDERTAGQGRSRSAGGRRTSCVWSCLARRRSCPCEAHNAVFRANLASILGECRGNGHSCVFHIPF